VWIGQITDRMHMKHGKLKLEVSSYTFKLIPHGGALINGSKFTFINIPSLISPLPGTSTCSRPLTTTKSMKGTILFISPQIPPDSGNSGRFQR
jgi:hypothetical protein